MWSRSSPFVLGSDTLEINTQKQGGLRLFFRHVGKRTGCGSAVFWTPGVQFELPSTSCRKEVTCFLRQVVLQDQVESLLREAAQAGALQEAGGPAGARCATHMDGWGVGGVGLGAGQCLCLDELYGLKHSVGQRRARFAQVGPSTIAFCPSAMALL